MPLVRQITVLHSGWLHALLLLAVTLGIWLQRGLHTAPIEWDRAYFTYLGQALLRGEPIYANSFMSYPPLGSLALAASMAVGEIFGMTGYLAPRYAATALGAASVIGIALLTRRATGSAAAGFASGIVLASFGPLVDSLVSTLEPKVLLMFLSVVACSAVQRRAWLLAGAAAALAVTCWQPAVVVPVACGAVAIWHARRRPCLPLWRYAGGLLLGLLPSAFYLAVTDGWVDYWYRGFVIPADFELGAASAQPLHWLKVMQLQFPAERWLFALGGLGLAAFLLQSLRAALRGRESQLVSTRFGAVPLVTLGWIGWNSFVFGNYPDMLPFLPFVAFFAGWLCHVSHDVLTSSLARHWPARKPVASVAFYLPLLLALAAYGLWDERAPAQGLTLRQQETLVHRIVESAGSDGELVALSAEAVYVLGERRSPNRFLRIGDAWGSYLHLVGLPSCRAAHDDMLSHQPMVVVIRIGPRSHACQKRLAPALRRRGYTEETIRVRPQTLWQVYRRPREPEQELSDEDIFRDM